MRTIEIYRFDELKPEVQERLITNCKQAKYKVGQIVTAAYEVELRAKGYDVSFDRHFNPRVRMSPRKLMELCGIPVRKMLRMLVDEHVEIYDCQCYNYVPSTKERVFRAVEELCDQLDESIQELSHKWRQEIDRRIHEDASYRELATAYLMEREYFEDGVTYRGPK